MKRINRLFIGIICFILLSGFNFAEEIGLDKKITTDVSKTKTVEVTEKNDSVGGYVLPDNIESYLKKIEDNPLKKKGGIKFGTPILPTTYDIRDVDGVSYAPAIRDQGSLSLCWAFALNSMLESFALKHNLGTYNFSENQLDLALNSLDLYNDYYLANTTETDLVYPLDDGHELGDGTSYIEGLLPWVLGMGPTTETAFGYEYFDTLETYNTLIQNPAKYTDASYSNFEINDVENYGVYLDYGTHNLEYYKTTVREDIDYMYIDVVKNHIMENGAIASAMMAPPNMGLDDTVFFYTPYDLANASKYYELLADGYGGHAITVIGWDDNYGDVDNDGTGDGAWLVQNSWGDVLSYFYISYFDPTIAASFIGILGASVKDYNTQYNDSFADDGGTFNGGYYDATYIIGEEVETLKSVKIYAVANGEDANSITLSVESDEGICLPNESYDVYIGFKTFTFDECEVSGDLDISFDGISSSDVYHVTVNTSRTDTTTDKLISRILGSSADVDGYYMNRVDSAFITYIATKNIESYSDDGFIVVDENDDDITSHFKITQYTPFVNGSTMVRLDQISKIQAKEITLKLKYKDNNVDKTIDVEKFEVYTIDGEGTMASPYLIKVPQDFLVMNNSDAYYKMNNDVDFDTLTTYPFGRFYNDGYGWEGIKFSGVFDGNGHTIKNLHTRSSGLFDSLADATVKNLRFDNAVVEGQSGNFASVLGDGMGGNTIDNIEIVNSEVTGIDECASGLMSAVFDEESITNIKIKDSIIRSDADVAGLICEVYDNKLATSNTIISNTFIENTIISTTMQSDYSKIRNEQIGFLINNIERENYDTGDTTTKLQITNNKYVQALDSNTSYTNANNSYGYIRTYPNYVDADELDLDLTTTNMITAASAKDVDSFTGFDFVNTWVINTGETPRLKIFDVPTTIDPATVTSTEYVVANNKYIKNVPEGLSLEEINEDLITPSDEVSKTFFGLDGGRVNSNTTPVATGMEMIVDNGYQSKKYVLIVNGDVDSNGAVNILDFRRVSNFITTTDEETQNTILIIDAQKAAADVNNDDEINILDFRRISNYLVSGSY